MIIDCIEKRVIKKLKSKAAVLIGLLIVLLILLFVFLRPGIVAEQVEIIEKYYPPKKTLEMFTEEQFNEINIKFYFIHRTNEKLYTR